MSYTVINFKTKKALKEAVSGWLETKKTGIAQKNARAVFCCQTGLGPDLSNYTGKITLEGPHYPAAHTWYAEAWLENGIVVKVR